MTPPLPPQVSSGPSDGTKSSAGNSPQTGRGTFNMPRYANLRDGDLVKRKSNGCQNIVGTLVFVVTLILLGCAIAQAAGPHPDCMGIPAC